MKHIELVTATATAPSTGAAAAAVTGDSLTVKNGRRGVRILSAWACLQTAGFVQIVRPSGHDTTRDFRQRVPASEVDLLLPPGLALDVEPQELLGVTIAGSATAGDVEQVCMLLEYDDLPGTNQRLISWSELMRKTEKLLTVEFTITTTAGPGYGGDELINAESALLQANRDYAVIGAKVAVECGALTIRGPDTGNVRIGIPGNDLDGELTNGWFGTLARAFNRALIPVINSGNQNSTYIGAHTDENAAAVPGSLLLAMLK